MRISDWSSDVCSSDLTATMAVAVLVPLTFAMEPASALILMGAIYTGAIYGGAYAAVLLNTPGTPSAIATTFDGYPMAKRGDGDLAITAACLASVVGGLVRSEEHTSELQSLMRNSYAVFCLKKQ